MTDRIPRQIDRRIRQALAELSEPWEVVKKRDHYFVDFPDGERVCIGNNSNKGTDPYTKKTLQHLSKRR